MLICTSVLEVVYAFSCLFFFSSRRRHTRFDCDWSSDVCSSDLSFRQREVQSLQQRMQTPVVPPSGFAAAPPAPPAGVPESAQAGGPGLVGRTTIVPDQATNSLVIRTAPPNFSVLQETIEQLDVRPPQVLLEVLIAEVTLDRASQFGINWQLLTQRGVSEIGRAHV